MTATRTHIAAAMSDPACNPAFRRRWTTQPWEIEEIEALSRLEARRGNEEKAAELAMRALRLRAAEASR